MNKKIAIKGKARPSAQAGINRNSTGQRIIEHAVELGTYQFVRGFGMKWERLKERYNDREDAAWLARYYRCIKGRASRVVSITTKCR